MDKLCADNVNLSFISYSIIKDSQKDLESALVFLN
jgi:hypothetical protein